MTSEDIIKEAKKRMITIRNGGAITPHLFWFKEQFYELVIEIARGESKCTCGCDFKDGCLCIQNRNGYNKKCQEILNKAKEWK